MVDNSIDISIIIVNWNARELLRRCLASIEAGRGTLSLEVIVVDNASSDDSVRMVRDEFSWVKLIVSQENLGYTRGNNLGALGFRGRHLFILNPDTEIVGDALQQMRVYLDTHSTVGAVGPQLLNPDGSVQSSRRRFPDLVTAFFSDSPFSWRWFHHNRFTRAYLMSDSSDTEIQPVDWLVGAALMIKRESWQAIGPFDERFFMYSDEVDWCHRCRDLGWEIHYLPTAQVIHCHKGSASQVGRLTQFRFLRSRVLYLQKYFGAGWANIVRCFFLINYACFLLEDRVKWLLGSRQATRRQRIDDYWKMLRSGLR